MTSYARPQGDPTDVVGRRIGAYILDGLLMGAISAAILIPMFLSASVEAPAGTVRCNTSGNSNSSSFNRGFNEGLNQDFNNGFNNGLNSTSGPSICFSGGDTVRYIPAGEEGGFVAKVYGFIFGLQALNLVVLQGLTGASVGKMIVGLRVVRTDGTKAGIGWAALRWIMLYIDSACCFLPGAILVFTTKGHRRLGDMVAGTYVVGRSSMNTSVQVPTAAAAPYGGGYQPVDPNAGTPGAWPAPGSPGQPTAGSWGAPAPATEASADSPTWDSARNAYIQFDRDRGAWVQWDDNLKVWGPINQ